MLSIRVKVMMLRTSTARLKEVLDRNGMRHIGEVVKAQLECIDDLIQDIEEMELDNEDGERGHISYNGDN